MDPQDYTPADAYAQRVADNMPQFFEVTNAIIALIRAIRALEKCELVAKADTVDRLTEVIEEVIMESLRFNENERFPDYVSQEFTRMLKRERDFWTFAIRKDEADAKLAQPTINLAGMVQSILTGGKS
jgi:hypothetical protein